MTREIPLTGKYAEGRATIVDDEDFDLLSKFRWRCYPDRGTFYAVRATKRLGRQHLVWMHRVIAGTPAGTLTDHVDGDGLNNLRSNLRHATHLLNGANRLRETRVSATGFRGVYRIPNAHTRPFVARLRYDGKLRLVGFFGTAIEAAHAYDAAKRSIFGDHVALNFPEV